jgi:hypothetical protein
VCVGVCGCGCVGGGEQAVLYEDGQTHRSGMLGQSPLARDEEEDAGSACRSPCVVENHRISLRVHDKTIGPHSDTK